MRVLARLVAVPWLQPGLLQLLRSSSGKKKSKKKKTKKDKKKAKKKQKKDRRQKSALVQGEMSLAGTKDIPPCNL